MPNNTIKHPVGKEEGRLLVGKSLGNVVLDAIAEKQIARKPKHASQFLLVGDASKHRHGTALREAANDDPRGTDALVQLLLDQRVEVLARTENSAFILISERFFIVELPDCQNEN